MSDVTRILGQIENGDPAAAEALKALDARFGGDVQVPGDPYATHVRIGERRVVDYLTELSKERKA